MTAGLTPAHRGDAASCSALGSTLLVAARRLESGQPELSDALHRLGAELQRYAVSLRAIWLAERSAAGSLPPPGRSRAARMSAASRRGRADAGLRHAADAACLGFESSLPGPNPRKPAASVDHA